jgi:hypothetical protein
MKAKIKALLNLIKKNDGRGIASFFKKEKETEQLENVVQMKLPHDFVYSFYGTTIKKVKDKTKAFTLSGVYYENDTNDGKIKIKLSLTEPSKVFDQLSKNEWKIKQILIDKDAIGIIAIDDNGNLIPLVEKNKIKKIKEKSIKQNIDGFNGDTKQLNALILKKNKSEDKKEEDENLLSLASSKAILASEKIPALTESFAEITKPVMNLEKVKKIVAEQELQKKAAAIPKTPRKTPVRKRKPTVKSAPK